VAVPPKLFIVVSYLGRGGTERQMLEFVRSAHPHHAACTVLCLSDQEGELADEVRATGARVEVLGIRRPHVVGGMRKLARLLREERPDAVYALLFHQYCVALPVARAVLPSAARIAGRRHLAAFDVSSIPAARRLRLIADSVSDLVIGNSQAVRDDWLRENPRLSGHFVVVPNGLRVIESEPEPPRPDGRLRIVCTARLVDWKGHVVLIDALGRLSGRDDWHAELIGDGPEREAIERQVSHLGLGDRVTLHGSLPAERVHAVVAGSDLSVLPSFGEGMPNAVMEAMAHGVACVATDVAGVQELLGSGAGLIVPPHDAAALADGLAHMLDEPELRAAAGAEGSRVIRERHSIEAMRDATLAAVQRAIDSRSGSAAPGAQAPAAAQRRAS
jgi:glycosyltransferase involved in cell wall biosynthesis